jgi:hypothetical protein
MIRRTSAPSAGSSLLPSPDADYIDRLSSFVGYLKAPFLIGLKLAVDVLEQLACCCGGLPPSGFVVLQLRALVIDAWCPGVHIEIPAPCRENAAQNTRFLSNFRTSVLDRLAFQCVDSFSRPPTVPSSSPLASVKVTYFPVLSAIACARRIASSSSSRTRLILPGEITAIRRIEGRVMGYLIR